MKLRLPTTWDPAKASRFFRLRGPLADDPTAKILHALGLGLFIWLAVHVVVVVPLFVARKEASTALALLGAILLAGSLVLLRRGALRSASVVCLLAIWIPTTIVILLGGGIRSPQLTLYISIPILAAWLLGSGAALISSGVCVLIALIMAVGEAYGVVLPRYFPGTPVGLWSNFVEAILIASVPVMVVLRNLNESLRTARRLIVKLREAQESLNRITETSPIGIIAVDREGLIRFANAGAETIFGLTRDEASHRTYNDPAWRITDHKGNPIGDEELPFRQVQRSLQPVRNARLAVVRGDGRRSLLSINAAPVLTQEGRFDGMVSAIEDVTEPARAEAELRKYRERLEELVQQRTAELEESRDQERVARDQAQAANRAKSAFLANMSHELRTPLNSILGFSRLLRAKALSEEQSAPLDIINRSGEHLLALIDDVLDVAKIEAGKVGLTIGACDVIALVRDVIDMMRVRADGRDLALAWMGSHDFPPYVRIDASKLRQILINLLGNAVKFTEKGSVTLRLSAAPPDQSGLARLRFEVEDTGPGISREDQSRIFEPFVQAATTKAPSGTGLGLTITRRFIEMMSGTLNLESEPGRGSKFVVEVPAELAQEADVPGDERRGERLPVLEPDQPEYRVLIVEDNPENARLLEQMLRHAGFWVRTAGNGALGVELFQTWQPHFIWMDIRMPVMGGTEAAQRIRRLEGGGKVRIGALTASVFGSELDEVLAAGMDEFVRKPYRPQEIFACMERQLGVRYLPVEPPAWEPETAAAEVSPEDLADLAPQLRRDLAEAVISLDGERISASIDRVAETNAAVAAALRRMKDRFAYTAILNAVERSESEAVV